jgi:uncharacterized membrane protein
MIGPLSFPDPTMTDPLPPSPARSHRLPVGLRHLSARPRLAAALAVFVVVAGLGAASGAWRWPTVVLVAWNVAVLLLIALDFVMIAGSDERTMRRRAALLDDGQQTILALSVIAAVASLIAIAAELAVVRDLGGAVRLAHVALAALTVATAWTFIHVMFAVHYAHEWIKSRDAAAGPGLRIPGEDHPDYWDFLYVAVVIGTSGQTADVEFTSKRMRRIGLVHCTLAFFFNTTVLALTVNIAAGLI